MHLTKIYLSFLAGKIFQENCFYKFCVTNLLKVKFFLLIDNKIILWSYFNRSLAEMSSEESLAKMKSHFDENSHLKEPMDRFNPDEPITLTSHDLLATRDSSQPL